MLKCDICKLTENIQLVMVGVDSFAQYEDKDSCNYLMCKECIIKLNEHIRKEGVLFV